MAVTEEGPLILDLQGNLTSEGLQLQEAFPLSGEEITSLKPAQWAPLSGWINAPSPGQKILDLDPQKLEWILKNGDKKPQSLPFLRFYDQILQWNARQITLIRQNRLMALNWEGDILGERGINDPNILADFQEDTGQWLIINRRTGTVTVADHSFALFQKRDAPLPLWDKALSDSMKALNYPLALRIVEKAQGALKDQVSEGILTEKTADYFKRWKQIQSELLTSFSDPPYIIRSRDGFWIGDFSRIERPITVEYHLVGGNKGLQEIRDPEYLLPKPMSPLFVLIHTGKEDYWHLLAN